MSKCVALIRTRVGLLIEGSVEKAVGWGSSLKVGVGFPILFFQRQIHDHIRQRKSKNERTGQRKFQAKLEISNSGWGVSRLTEMMPSY